MTAGLRDVALNRRLLLSLSLLLVAFVLAGLAFYSLQLASSSSVRVLPVLVTDIPIGLANPGLYFQKAVATYMADLVKFAVHQREILTAGALGYLAGIVLIWDAGLLVARLRKIAGAVILMSSFVMGVSCLSFVLFDLSLGSYWSFPLANLFTGNLNYVCCNTTTTVGYAACMFFICATTGFVMSLHELVGGWLRPLWNTIRFFDVPMLLLLEVGLYWYSPRWMQWYAIASFKWQYDGVYILSNGNVLLAALALAILGYVVQPSIQFILPRLRLLRVPSEHGSHGRSEAIRGLSEVL